MKKALLVAARVFFGFLGFLGIIDLVSLCVNMWFSLFLLLFCGGVLLLLDVVSVESGKEASQRKQR